MKPVTAVIVEMAARKLGLLDNDSGNSSTDMITNLKRSLLLSSGSLEVRISVFPGILRIA